MMRALSEVVALDRGIVPRAVPNKGPLAVVVAGTEAEGCSA